MSQFDEMLRRSGWNTRPEKEITIPSSSNPLVNAARAIAICAYPQKSQLNRDGKAHKYSDALLAYTARAAQWTGHVEHIPPWARKLKAEKMWTRLKTGHHNLMRSFVLRDLIASALIRKFQNDRAQEGERSTFTIKFSPDLTRATIDIPLKETKYGPILCGTIPEQEKSSLRAAIADHKVALEPYAGISSRIEGPDDELFYQNTLNRLVRPTLQIAHILDIVWKAATEFREEAQQRRLPIDQILMRKATWAADIHAQTIKNEWIACSNMRELGIQSCSCKLIHLGPVPDS
jgi:hypothetical protein